MTIPKTKTSAAPKAKADAKLARTLRSDSAQRAAQLRQELLGRHKLAAGARLDWLKRRRRFHAAQLRVAGDPEPDAKDKAEEAGDATAGSATLTRAIGMVTRIRRLCCRRLA